jgi:hypothetical protein
MADFVRLDMVFERIPQFFVDHYRHELEYWAAKGREVGEVAVVKLDRPVEPLIVHADARRIIGVRLKAQLDLSRPQNPRIVVTPQTEEDAAAIERHVFDLKTQVLH